MYALTEVVSAMFACVDQSLSMSTACQVAITNDPTDLLDDKTPKAMTDENERPADLLRDVSASRRNRSHNPKFEIVGSYLRCLADPTERPKQVFSMIFQRFTDRIRLPSSIVVEKQNASV